MRQSISYCIFYEICISIIINKKKWDLFNIYNIENDRDLSSLRWTLDSEDDLIFIKEIYRYLYKKDTIFHMEEVLKLLKEKPSLIEINQNHIRNEGYLKSVNEENKIGKK